MESNDFSLFMRSLSKVELRRCRPLLGTYVEIAATGADRSRLEQAVENAFAAIAEVHRLMSYHDPASDVCRLNREGFPKGVVVHPWTWHVLKSAQEFNRESRDAFDITVAPLLTKQNHLPDLGYEVDHRAGAQDIFLKENCLVFFRRRLAIDLGGIAKGFAVDRAIEALREGGVSTAIVNAGGDLRVCGTTRFQIHLRHPQTGNHSGGVVLLRDRALATSATYFSRGPSSGGASALFDGISRRPCREEVSVSVAANDCLTADALTKIVLALREKAAPILQRHGADAVLLERDLTVRRIPD